MVDESGVKSVLNGSPAKNFDVDGKGSVTLVRVDKKEGYQLVGLSFLACWRIWGGKELWTRTM